MVPEIAITFDCEGTPLIGIVHGCERSARRGVLTVVAGGPQYRAGCCRALVELARTFAAAGVPVMRFDYRGLGDSEGPYLGFENVEADLAAAIRAFRAAVPGLTEVVLWGGCDAASAIMINAWRFPDVCGVVVGNPWVHIDETSARVLVKHYYGSRLRDPAFWRKLRRFEFNPWPAIQTVFRAIGDAANGAVQRYAPRSADQGPEARPEAVSGFVDRMRDGMKRFPGRVLMVMSGRSIVSKEFDDLLQTDRDWHDAMHGRAVLDWHKVADADQAFSSCAARRELIRVGCDWLLAWAAAEQSSS